MCPPSSFTLDAPSSSSHAFIADPHDIVPPYPICTSAYQLVKQSLPSAIFNHSLRTYLYTKAFAEYPHSPWVTPDRLPLLFAACLFHDMGCTADNDGPQRFEVCGADAAIEHLRKFGVDEADLHEVWTAIALHTSPGIAERISPLARILRLAVLKDFNCLGGNPLVTQSEMKLIDQISQSTIEKQYPRLNPEKVLGDAVVEQGMRQPTKAPAASWAGVLVRAAKEEPQWKGVNKAF